MVARRLTAHMLIFYGLFNRFDKVTVLLLFSLSLFFPSFLPAGTLWNAVLSLSTSHPSSLSHSSSDRLLSPHHTCIVQLFQRHAGTVKKCTDNEKRVDVSSKNDMFRLFTQAARRPALIKMMCAERHTSLSSYYLMTIFIHCERSCQLSVEEEIYTV